MKLYLIGGKARTGKDTLGKFIKDAYQSSLKQATILHITEPLDEFAKNHFGWDGKDETKPRELFQKLGIEVIRKQLGKENLLKDHLVDKIEILKNFFDVLIITDLRLREEFTFLKEKYKDAITIHVLRDVTTNMKEEEKEHVTEKDLESDFSYDYVLQNKTEEEMEAFSKKLVEQEERKCL